MRHLAFRWDTSVLLIMYVSPQKLTWFWDDVFKYHLWQSSCKTYTQWKFLQNVQVWSEALCNQWENYWSVLERKLFKKKQTLLTESPSAVKREVSRERSCNKIYFVCLCNEGVHVTCTLVYFSNQSTYFSWLSRTSIVDIQTTLP